MDYNLYKRYKSSRLMNYIHLDKNVKSIREIRCRLNINMKEIIKAEVLNLLDAGIICPISDNS